MLERVKVPPTVSFAVSSIFTVAVPLLSRARVLERVVAPVTARVPAIAVIDAAVLAPPVMVRISLVDPSPLATLSFK